MCEIKTSEELIKELLPDDVSQLIDELVSKGSMCSEYSGDTAEVKTVIAKNIKLEALVGVHVFSESFLAIRIPVITNESDFEKLKQFSEELEAVLLLYACSGVEPAKTLVQTFIDRDSGSNAPVN